MNSNRNLLIYLAILHDGDYDKVLDDVTNHKYPSIEEADEVVSKLKCNTLTILDEEYPSYLKKMNRPPYVLFYYGDISLIDEEHLKTNLGVVGTRKATYYGLTNTYRLVREVSKKCNIVSGLALGIDARAHRSAINARTKTIAVLGSGIDNPWPDLNVELYQDIIASGGLVVSEYPNMSEPNMAHFPIRNRLIVMFSSALLVTEAYDFKTGTSITVRFAHLYNKPVMAIPYSLKYHNSFCNHLIREGERLIRNGNDILLEMGLNEK